MGGRRELVPTSCPQTALASPVHVLPHTCPLRLLQDPPLPPHSFPQLNNLLKNIQKEKRRTLSQIYAAYVLVAMSLSSEV